MISACMVVIELKNCGSTNCMPGLNSSRRMTIAIAPPMKNIDAGEHQVHRADVLVVGGVHPAPPKPCGLWSWSSSCVACVSAWRVLSAMGSITLLNEVRVRVSRRAGARAAVALASRRAAAARASARRALPFSQASKSALERTSTTIGMKPWSRPHSSAHWPRYRPVLSASISNQASLTKPGMASFLTPKAGTHQEWMTSCAGDQQAHLDADRHHQRVVDVQQVVVDRVRDRCRSRAARAASLSRDRGARRR